MKQLSLSRMVAVACMLAAGSASVSAAQTKHSGDPARWYKGDSTQQQRTAVLKKEINAAYAEQAAACKHRKSGQQGCMEQARATYQHDMANVRQLVANAPQSEISERIVSTTPIEGGQTGSGSSAYGSSSGGQTGSSSIGQSSSSIGQSGSSIGQTGGMGTGSQSMGNSGSMGNSSSMGSSQSMSGQPPTGAAQSGSMNGATGATGSSGTYGNSATGAGQGAAPMGAPTNSGATNSAGSAGSTATQPGMSGTGTSQSIGAGTGATQSDMQGQGQQGAGTPPPVQR